MLLKYRFSQVKEPNMDPIDLVNTHDVFKGKEVDGAVYGTTDTFKSYDGLDAALPGDDDDDNNIDSNLNRKGGNTDGANFDG